MARFSRESVDRVKEAADIVEIVSAHTDLRRAGQRYTGLCPFHDERTPSFSVDPLQKIYYCFGCEAGGDVFRFVEEKEGLDFPDAVESLAERYGVELEREREDPRAEQARRKRARLYELLQRTAEFYARFLWDSPKAAKARDYLAERGLKEEVLRDFGVGMAPPVWDQVLVSSQRAKFTLPELVGAGLIQKGRQGGHYDRFRKRIMFPIRDQRGRVLGFGARALSADQRPKYLNSPEGELYRKSETLYGIDRARAAVAKAKQIELRVAAMPEDADPADMLAAGEIERFRELVEGAVDLVEFRVGTILARADLGDPAGRERALTEVAPVVKAREGTVAFDELVRSVADRLDTDPSLVSERVRSARIEELDRRPATPPTGDAAG